MEKNLVETLVQRLDGWQSVLTGMGTARDRTTSVSFTPKIIPHTMAKALWEGDDMAARAIEVWPEEMLRAGYRITTAKGNDADEAVTNHLETIGFEEALHQALCFQRAYGGGVILLGANDGSTDWSQPLDMDKVQSLDWLQAYDASEVFPSQWYGDGMAAKFLRPSHYRIGAAGKSTSDIHESRFLIFDGIRVSSNYQESVNGGWGVGVFPRLWTVLSGFNMGWSGAWHLLSDFAQGVYKMKGLAGNLLKNQDQVMQRLHTIDLAKSTMRSIVVDADLEDYSRMATPISGLSDVLDKANTRLAAAADMPVMLLFGQSPGGLGSTGDGEMRSFYGRVAAKQTKVLKPAIMRIVGLLAAKYKLEPGYKIVFNALWEPTELEAAQARSTQATTDVAYINAQVVTPEEIAASRFSAGGYSFETKLDWEAREEFNTALAAPDPATDVVTEDPADIDGRNKGQEVTIDPTLTPEI